MGQLEGQKPKLPRHFSLIGSKPGVDGEHDPVNHQRLREQISGIAGVQELRPVKACMGEHLWMVIHRGDDETINNIDGIAKLFHQDYAVHSSNLENTQHRFDGKPAAKGRGMLHGDSLESPHVVLPSGHKIRLLMDYAEGEKTELPNQEEFREPVKEVAEKEFGKSEEAKQRKEANLKLLKSRLEELKKHADKLKAVRVILAGKELLKSGEESCQDCGSRELHCACWAGLTKPQISLIKGQVILSFDPKWDENDRQAYLDDFKRRATYLIKNGR